MKLHVSPYSGHRHTWHTTARSLAFLHPGHGFFLDKTVSQEKKACTGCRRTRARAAESQVCLWPDNWKTCNFMVPRGLEPRTLRLLAARSNQLSYETLQRVAAPALRTARCAAVVRNNSRGQPPPGVPRPSHHTPSLPLPQPPQSPMVASVVRGHT